MNDLRLKVADAEDASTIATWFASIDEVRLFAGTTATWPLGADDIVRRNSPDSTFAAYSGDSLIGTITLRGLGHARVHLARIAVAPACRGRGLATPLVEAGLAVAESRGSTRQTLLVVPGNEPALRAYRRAGFRDTGIDSEHPEYVLMTRESPGR